MWYFKLFRYISFFSCCTFLDYIFCFIWLNLCIWCECVHLQYYVLRCTHYHRNVLLVTTLFFAFAQLLVTIFCSHGNLLLGLSINYSLRPSHTHSATKRGRKKFSWKRERRKSKKNAQIKQDALALITLRAHIMENCYIYCPFIFRKAHMMDYYLFLWNKIY